jgi:TolA-binding protein
MTRISIRTIPFLLVIALCGGALGVALGDKPDLKLNAMDGSRIDLSACRGKLVLIDFWSGRSTLSRTAEARIQELNTRFANKGLVIIGINCDPKISDAEQYVHDLKITWAQYHERDGYRGPVGKAWNVQRLPYYFMIGPDGAVLWAGYKSGIEDIVADEMVRHPPPIIDPDTFGKASAELDAAEKAMADLDFAAAVKALARVPESAKRNATIAKRLASALCKIDSAADHEMDQIAAMVAEKRYSEASGRLKELNPVLGATTRPAVRQRLSDLLSDPQIKSVSQQAEKEAAAASALSAARKFRDEGDHETAYARHKGIAQDYPQTEGGQTAAQLLKAYEADADLIQRINSKSSVDRAKAALALADSYIQNGRTDLARSKYQQVISDFPNTSFAEQAQKALDAMK